MGAIAMFTSALISSHAIINSTFQTGQPLKETRRNRDSSCRSSRHLAVCGDLSAKISRRALSFALPVFSSILVAPQAWPKEDVRDTKQRRYETVQEVNLPNGIRYLDLSVGTGPEVTTGDTVVIHYTSRLLGFNGKTLDSSYAHVVDGFPEPFTFRLGDPDVIQGLSSMVVGMQIGGKRRAIIPPSLSYQSSMDEPRVGDFQALRRLESVIGNPNRDATVLFDVELLKRR
eukprot:jgi/Mesvir1/16817/Mv15178-RA.1